MVFWLWFITVIVFSFILASYRSEILRLRRLIQWNEEDANQIKKDNSKLWERVHSDHLNDLRWQALIEQYLGITIHKVNGPTWEVVQDKQIKNRR